ncbi:uncharacterized protein LOC113280647 [Papaver somniferum]|uniref:uncharacterized protein LOC113280647 n=1 Tax=Papaver somniferum TaxID=3469 RepID=UPI000E6FD369|nr:uncharacterized protein LOC113280647 [Papaver somniferum]
MNWKVLPWTSKVCARQEEMKEEIAAIGSDKKNDRRRHGARWLGTRTKLGAMDDGSSGEVRDDHDDVGKNGKMCGGADRKRQALTCLSWQLLKVVLNLWHLNGGITKVELKSSLIHHLPKFKGLPGEDPNRHLQNFQHKMTSLRQGTEDSDTAMLQAFPFSLIDMAEEWMYYLPPGSITTWSEMNKLFLEKYFPASKAAVVRKEISGILQITGESLYEYWERYKKLLATSLIESMASNAQKFYTRNNSSVRRVSEIGESTQSEQRINNIEKVVQRMAAVIIPTYEEESEQVNVVFPNQRPGYNPYSNTYNPGWKDHPNFSYANKQAAAPNPYARQGGFQQPQIPSQSQSQVPKDDVSEKMITMMQGLSSMFQHSQQKTDSAIKDLHTQIGQMATEINQLKAQASTKLPSQTFVNPRENVNAVLLRSEKQTEEPKQQEKASHDFEKEVEVETFLKEKPTSTGQTKDTVGESASDMLLKKIPTKFKDPDGFTVPINIGERRFERALLDFGASISVMSADVYDCLNLGALKETGIIIQLANKSNIYLKNFLCIMLSS